MDKANKHPQDELMAAYSAGSLPLSQALCISAHLEHCPGMHAQIATAQSRG